MKKVGRRSLFYKNGKPCFSFGVFRKIVIIFAIKH